MKVLHLITGMNVGGAETMLARLMEIERASQRVRPQIISLMAPGPVGERVARTGTPVHSLGMRGGVPSLLAAIRLIKLTRGIAPDLIVGWMHHGQMAATLAAAASAGKTPVIWNVRHSLGGFDQEKPLTRFILRLGALFSSQPAAIVYNSRTASRQYAALGYRPREAIVIPNGFDTSACGNREQARRTLRSRFSIRDDRVLIGAIARNHPMKDIPNLITAFGQVLKVRADAHLLLVGDGMNRQSSAVAQLLSALPVHSWTVAGHRTDVAMWLAGLDVLALPSAWGEGFPNILGEAMACGVPCVATDVGDSAWVIGSAGFVVRPRDVDGLTAAILELTEMGSEARQSLGRKARCRIEQRFALDAISREYLALYEKYGRGPSLVSGGRASAAAASGR
jgi:glycosyltransferase involved in cell wall biosynthesis